MTSDILMDLRNHARKLAKAMPVASFYLDHATEMAVAWDLFFNNSALLKLQEDSLPFLYDDYMFGIEHSKKVAQDAATIVLCEETGLTQEEKRHLCFLAEVAGLVHDVQRGEDEHAHRSADAVANILDGYAISADDVALIVRAVAGHEDRADPGDYPDLPTRLLCQALYDADKFRYGPDIFATTMWLFCDYNSWDLAEIAGQFPKGISAARAVVHTFRTDVGRRYGPELIQQGIKLGETMHRMLIEASRKG